MIFTRVFYVTNPSQFCPVFFSSQKQHDLIGQQTLNALGACKQSPHNGSYNDPHNALGSCKHVSNPHNALRSGKQYPQ